MGRFTGYLDGVNVHVSVYARDASDAQLLAKTIRFLLYRDSGPTLTFTRRQQVEHEAYLTLTPNVPERTWPRCWRPARSDPPGTRYW